MSFRIYGLSSPQAAVAIVRSIPDFWSGINGELVAPEKAHPDTLFDMTVYFSRALVVEGAVIPEESAPKPSDQVNRLFFGQRLPREVRFQKAGIGSRKALALAKEAICQCLAHGYTGNLLFAHSFPRSIESKCRASACFRFGPYASQTANGVLRPHVELSWFRKLRGQPADVAVIDEVCQSARLPLISEVGIESPQPQSTA